jgi:hypothetical protein
MEVIDEEGRLFGVVNVIDALVVLFVLAVLVAGVAFVNPFGTDPEPATGDPEPAPSDPDVATRYATIDLGAQPAYIADRISAGDTATFPGQPGNLTVTDVYAAPGRKPDTTAAVVRVRITGRLVDRPGRDTASFAFGGSRLRSGQNLAFSTLEYNASGTVTAVETSGASFDRNATRTVLTTTLPTATADTITTGDMMRIAGRTVATVESVRVYPTADSGQRRVQLGVTLQTIERGGRTMFGDRAIRVGSAMPITTEQYALNGTILTRGSLTPPGTVATTTVRVELEGVSPDIANSLRVGMTETTRGETLARVTDRRVENATVILTSERGEIFAREHPRKKDVTLTVELATRRTASGLQFHGRALQTGTGVVLDFESVTVRGTVIEIEG